MIEFVKLSCPSCGGKLEISKDIHRFSCGHCGNEHVVIRKGGVVTINAVEESIEKIERSTDKTAAELAIKRLKEEIPKLEEELKSITRGYRSDVTSLYFQYLSFQGKKGLSGLFSKEAEREETVHGLTVKELPELIKYMKSELKKLKKPIQQEYSQKIIGQAERILFLKLEIPKKYASLKENLSLVDS